MEEVSRDRDQIVVSILSIKIIIHIHMTLYILNKSISVMNYGEGHTEKVNLVVMLSSVAQDKETSFNATDNDGVALEEGVAGPGAMETRGVTVRG